MKSAIRFGCGSPASASAFGESQYDLYFRIWSRKPLRSIMSEFDIMMSIQAHISICGPGSFDDTNFEVGIRLENMVYAMEDKDIRPSDSLRAINDLLFDAYQAMKTFRIKAPDRQRILDFLHDACKSHDIPTTRFGFDMQTGFGWTTDSVIYDELLEACGDYDIYIDID